METGVAMSKQKSDETVDTYYPGKGSPWGDFLHHRVRVLVEFQEEGKSPEETARILSMDPRQVRLILEAAAQQKLNVRT